MGMTGAPLYTRPEAVAHLRVGGRSLDVPLAALDLGSYAADGHVRRTVARYLGLAEAKLDAYVIDRHPNGNLTVRPEAVFG